jgi:hypothetical protein
MKNTVRNAHAWAALLLLAAACGDSGGGDDNKDAGKDASVETDAESDAETPEDEGGTVEDDGGGREPGGGDPDGGGTTGGGDATVMMDADTDAGTTDTGVTEDTGIGGGDDASVDTGVDSGPVLPTGCAEAAIVAATGGSVTSTDNHFTLTLAGAQLSADSTVRVCLVPAATSVAGLDGRVGDAYEITATNSATFAAATATFRNHSALPAVDATPTFDAPVARALPAGGTVANGTGNVLRMSKRTASADTATTLSATVAGPGHVYVGTLEAPGVYRVNMLSPTKTTFPTGEIINFGSTVTVTGSPVGTRVFEAEANGCDLDPLSYSPNGTAGGLTQPAAVLNNPTCTNRAYVSVRRVGGTTGNIVGAPATGTGAILAGGTTLDLQANDATPLGFYCRFPGAGKGAARLLFKNGATTELEITKDIEVACAFSGELVAFYDTIQVDRQPDPGTSVQAVASPATAFAATAYASIAPAAITATSVGDGFQFAASAVTPPLSGTGAPDQITVDTIVGTPATAQRSTVTLDFQTNQYVATPALTANPAFYAGLADGVAHIRLDGTLVDCGTASMTQMDLRFGPRTQGSTTVAVTGSTVDFVWIQARIPAAGAAPATVVTRWLDAAKLTDHQNVPLLDSAQRDAVGASSATEYTVGYFKVIWDESRRLYDQRILPIACGTALRFEAADVVP